LTGTSGGELLDRPSDCSVVTKDKSLLVDVGVMCFLCVCVWQIFITGSADAKDTRELLAVVQDRLIPGRVLALADGRDDSVLYRRSEVIRRMKPAGGTAAAYVCRHQTCSVPITAPQELDSLLKERQ